jgi:hypothetical protein
VELPDQIHLFRIMGVRVRRVAHQCGLHDRSNPPRFYPLHAKGKKFSNVDIHPSGGESLHGSRCHRHFQRQQVTNDF